MKNEKQPSVAVRNGRVARCKGLTLLLLSVGLAWIWTIQAETTRHPRSDLLGTPPSAQAAVGQEWLRSPGTQRTQTSSFSPDDALEQEEPPPPPSVVGDRRTATKEERVSLEEIASLLRPVGKIVPLDVLLREEEWASFSSKFEFFDVELKRINRAKHDLSIRKMEDKVSRGDFQEYFTEGTVLPADLFRISSESEEFQLTDVSWNEKLEKSVIRLFRYRLGEYGEMDRLFTDMRSLRFNQIREFTEFFLLLEPLQRAEREGAPR